MLKDQTNEICHVKKDQTNDIHVSLYKHHIRATQKKKKEKRMESIFSSTSRSPFESQLHYNSHTKYSFSSERKHIHIIKQDYYIDLKKT